MSRNSFAISCLLGCSVFANPTDLVVISGDAHCHSPSANTLEIRASDRAILHWQDFSIGLNETTKFIQPNSSCAVLNRVMGENLSSLQGRLEANGQVYLINPHGILIV